MAVAGGTLDLQGGGVTLAQLGTVTHTGGVVNLQTTLNNAGTTLNVGSGTAMGTLTLATNGTIANGTIADHGSGIAFAGGTLSGVSYDGTMDMSGSGSAVYVTNGLTLAGVNGTGSGTINLTGRRRPSDAQGRETLSNATINIGNSSTYDYIYNYDNAGAATLTLASNVTIDHVGKYVSVDTSEYSRSTSGIVNAGTINANLSGGSFTIAGGGFFTNQGTINVSNGDTLTISSSSWSNTGTMAVAGGTLDLQGGGVTLAQLGTVTNTGGVVNLQTTLNNAGTTLNVGSGTAMGTLTLATNGTIANGTIADHGSGIAFAGGTLSGVSYDGTMDMSGSGSAVYVTNGLTLAGVNGTGSGTINLTGAGGSQLDAQGSETLSNATINIGNSSTYDYIYNYDNAGAATLTLASNVTIDHVGKYVSVDTSEYSRSTSGIVNAGTINANLSGGSFTIAGGGFFTNQGTINVSNGDTLTISSSSWSNTGTMAVAGGTLDLQGGGVTLAQLGTVTNTGGVVNLQTTLNNAGTTLNVGSGTAMGTLTLATNGTIANGTIADHGSGIAFAGGTLSGVSYDGTMDMSGSGSAVYVTNGLTLAGVNGTGSGTINLTGAGGSQLDAQGSETLSNATINIGNSSTYDYIYNYDNAGAATLTLASNVTIDHVGKYVSVDTSEYSRSTSGIVNAGTINANLSGGSFTIAGGGFFTNQGTINVSNGDTLTISSSSWSNTGTMNANGGNINISVAEIGGGSALIYGTSQIEYSLASADNVTFEAGSTGQLLLLTSALFTGTITGFTGSSTGTPATSDKLDLRNINFASAQFAKSYANNVLTVTDGTNTTNIKMVGSYTLANFNFATDSNGGTLVTEITNQSVTIAPIEGNNIINATEAVAGVTLGGTVSGVAGGSNFNVTVTDNGATKTYVATVNGVGTTWSATIPATDATALANGTATITALVTGANGNQVTASQTVTVNVSGPTVTIVSDPTTDVTIGSQSEDRSHMLQD